MKSSDMVEALEINAAIDTMITDRQAIADRQKHHVDVLQETWDLVRLGHQYKDAGKTGIAGRKLQQLDCGKARNLGRRAER
ncbi:Uncharacterised protein [Escherichia coli]|uniref:Uncharacterized protein n=1 Tax=Escherichia coli TaxID=562 RepID=A0A2X1LCU9_ECOLX|nr:Uncharacterised protein [Escherichia coli]